jgi:predicted enzyme related to lactoylglutathione lyase
MLRGLTTVTFFAADLSAARDWYAELLGVEPYFAKEVGGAVAYVEFRIGDHQAELGLLDARFAPPGRCDAPGNSHAGERACEGVAQPGMTYWAVDDIEATLARLRDLGATVLAEPVEQGPGFVTAAVVDPFGNVLGVMFNQHYLDMAGARGPHPS